MCALSGALLLHLLRRLVAHHLFVEQLDVVAVRVHDEGHEALIVLVVHRNIMLFQLCHRGLHILDTDSNMTVRATMLIGSLAVVISQLQHGGLQLRPVPEEGERELVLLHIPRAQQLHAEPLRVEVDAALEIPDADHRVKKTRHMDSFERICGTTEKGSEL
ncbi:lactoylglutathione lyase [Strigomonas culicis]|uniref:Lactoylglutathione lyase n=1 Tax=Strigomonas culicis TaxID=28005 RepID=S9WGA1_9TRYP|nr:lactoylglutathione lyase [Strigomonas culicis]|eukprot:EPY34770.1 lactoylglutathione lyase [Strigomonas culicis]